MVRFQGLQVVTAVQLFLAALVHSALGSTKWDVYNGDGFRVRTKATDPEICSGASGVSGYIDSENDHMFFWAFESESSPETDPVVLWLSGGPGASSVAFGGLEELGPCRFDGANSTLRNPYSWNANATIIFVDQPFNVGFSYSPREIASLSSACSELYHFLTRLFLAKPEWAKLDFYVAGESYGGSWVPRIGWEIQQRQSSALANLVKSTTYEASRAPEINLKGIMIGNGLIDQTVQRRGFYETGCTGPHAIMNSTQCGVMLAGMQRCELLEQACRDSGYSRVVCEVSDSWCQEHEFLLIEQTPLNFYNFGMNCSEEEQECARYFAPTKLEKFLDSDRIRRGLGIDEESGGSVVINQAMFEAFSNNGEVGFPSAHWVSELLDQNIKVLIYAGNLDWACHAAGMRHLVNTLPWSSQPIFSLLQEQDVYAPQSTAPTRETSPPKSDWKSGFEARSRPQSHKPNLTSYHLAVKSSSSGQTPFSGVLDMEPTTRGEYWGKYKSYGPLTFMEIDGAGHMSPRDKGEAVLWMVNRFLLD